MWEYNNENIFTICLYEVFVKTEVICCKISGIIDQIASPRFTQLAKTTSTNN